MSCGRWLLMVANLWCFWIISRVNPPSVSLYFLKEKITLKGDLLEVNLGFLDYLMGLLERWSHLGTWRVRPRLGLQTSIHTCPSAWGFSWALVNKGMNIWGLSLKSNLEMEFRPLGLLIETTEAPKRVCVRCCTLWVESWSCVTWIPFLKSFPLSIKVKYAWYGTHRKISRK